MTITSSPLGRVSASVLGCLLCFTSAVLAQDASNPSGLTTLYEDGIAKIEERQSEQKQSIFDSYIKVLEGLATEYQQSGDLENLVKAKKEIQEAQSQRIVTDPFPAITEFREKLIQTVANIDAEAAEETLKLDKAYVEKMEGFRVEAVKAGDLDVAILIDKEVMKVKERINKTTIAQTPTPSIPLPTTPSPAVMVNPPKDVVTVSPLHTSPIIDDVELETGTHLMNSEQVILGQRDRPEGKKAPSGTLTVKPGTTIMDGQIYIDIGEMEAEGARFKDVKFSANLNGKLDAEDCLFDNSSIQKGGAWFNSYSSKWVLDNCVFRGVFVGNNNFSRRSIGLWVTDCTFIDVTFPSVEYWEDPAEESQLDQRTVEDCLFINCTIPDSMLLMTKDCRFENCTFVRDPDPAIIGKSRVTVTLYHGAQQFDAPPDYGKCGFVVKDASQMQSPPGDGSDLEYVVSGTMLDFK